MKKMCAFLILFVCAINALAQASFKAGWSNYQTRTWIHQYTYNIIDRDSIKLVLQDSASTFVSVDSMVVLTVNFYPMYLTRNIQYFNKAHQLEKTEDYNGENLQEVNQYSYDDKNRVRYHLEDNKISGKTEKQTYEYKTDKKNGDKITEETDYEEGRVEFYTHTYYNEKNVKYREVRLNDNNRDIVHEEKFFYGDNGKLKERSVYFPEWKVTKTFPEVAGNMPLKCYNTFPIPATDVVNLINRLYYMKRLITRNRALLSDAECTDFIYKYTNKTTCDIELVPTKVNHGRRAIFTYRQKMI